MHRCSVGRAALSRLLLPRQDVRAAQNCSSHVATLARSSPSACASHRLDQCYLRWRGVRRLRSRQWAHSLWLARLATLAVPFSAEQNFVSSHDTIEAAPGRYSHPGHVLPALGDVLACVERCRRHVHCSSISISTSRRACFWFAMPCQDHDGELTSLHYFSTESMQSNENATALPLAWGASWLDDFATVTVREPAGLSS